MTNEQIIQVVKAHSDGKQIQLMSGCSWFDIPDPGWDFFRQEYRVKPEKKFRPWKPEEVPMPCVVRSLNGKNRWQILSVSDYGAGSSDACADGGDVRISSFAALLECNEYSVDGGKTWNKCGVEE